MERVVKRIVLTGGPCAGKSSSLELIEQYFRNNNYVVYTVQESATELIKSGVKPFGVNAFDLYYFQDILLSYQLAKEKIIDEIVYNSSDDKIVIIYDRGTIDNKAYIGQKRFDNLLEKYNLNEVDLLNKYDLVIHLETGAKINNYNKDNVARSESEEDALVLDTKTYDAWKYHNNLIKVKSRDNFIEKQEEIIKIIEDFC